MDPLQRITERVWRLGDPDDPETPRPLLALEEFFAGNECAGSIGCNLPTLSAPDEMYQVLKRIAGRPEVADVRVQVSQFDDPDWPFSDTVFVFTSATPEEVLAWFPEDWAPDETWDGFLPDVRYEPCAVPDGTRPIACWWD
jgi:hypothetical protein